MCCCCAAVVELNAFFGKKVEFDAFVSEFVWMVDFYSAFFSSSSSPNVLITGSAAAAVIAYKFPRPAIKAAYIQMIYNTDETNR